MWANSCGLLGDIILSLLGKKRLRRKEPLLSDRRLGKADSLERGKRVPLRRGLPRTNVTSPGIQAALRWLFRKLPKSKWEEKEGEEERN